jgi:DNA-binding NarL/FixJ family response regulator
MNLYKRVVLPAVISATQGLNIGLYLVAGNGVGFKGQGMGLKKTGSFIEFYTPLTTKYIDMKKITIAIVDDHKLIRQMWAKMFEGNNEIEIKGESGTLDEALEMIKINMPDIVFLDINLAKGSGMDAVPLIRELSPGTRIIAISMHNQRAYAKKMLQLGAKAYITKNSSHEEMFKAIEEVMKGGVYVCAEIKHLLSDQFINYEPTGYGIKNLSIREIEIIKLIKDGLSSKTISSLLNIAIGTVEMHRYNILKKLKLKNTASLINFINNTDLTFI